MDGWPAGQMAAAFGSLSRRVRESLQRLRLSLCSLGSRWKALTRKMAKGKRVRNVGRDGRGRVRG